MMSIQNGYIQMKNVFVKSLRNFQCAKYVAALAVGTGITKGKLLLKAYSTHSVYSNKCIAIPINSSGIPQKISIPRARFD